MRYKSTPLSIRATPPSQRRPQRRRQDRQAAPRLRDRLSTLIIVALVPALIIPALGAGAASPPVLSVPSRAEAGAALTVVGDGFPRGATLVLAWNADLTDRRVKVSPRGTFAVSFGVPSDAPLGHHTIGAARLPKKQATSATGIVATAPIEVVESTDVPSTPAPTMTPRPTPSPTALPTASPTATPRPTAVPTAVPTPAPTPVPTPIPQAPAPPSNTSGVPMPTGNLPGWTMVFSDDFTTNVPLGSFPSAVSSKWSAYPSPWRDTSSKGMYAPEKTVSIANSMMDIWLHTENGVPLVAAPVPLLSGGNDQLYGRYAVRFRADPIDGYKAAWLLWPQSNVWPRDGEIDFPEGELDGTIHAFMHRMNATQGSDQDAFPTNQGFNAWHTAVIEWTPSSVTFILDGTVIGRSTSRIPSTPMHWVLQTETSLTSAYPPPSIQGHVQIDWVAAWRYTP